MKSFNSPAWFKGQWTQCLSYACSSALLLGLVACSSTPEKPKPTALVDFNSKVTAQKVWAVQLGPMNSTLSHNLSSGQLALVTSAGLVSLLKLKGLATKFANYRADFNSSEFSRRLETFAKNCLPQGQVVN